MNKEILKKAISRLSYSDLNVFKMQTYLKKHFESEPEITIVIDYLCQNNFIDENQQIQSLIAKYQQKGYGHSYILNKLLIANYPKEMVIANLNNINDNIDINSLLKHKKWQGSKKQVIEQAKQFLYNRGLKVNAYLDDIYLFFDDYDENDSYNKWLKKHLKLDIVKLKQKSYQLGYLKTTIDNGLRRIIDEKN